MLNSTDFVERAGEFQQNRGKLEAGTAVAFSGGGFPAMLFHAGALAHLIRLALARSADLERV
jgi:NTE family protein